MLEELTELAHKLEEVERLTLEHQGTPTDQVVGPLRVIASGLRQMIAAHLAHLADEIRHWEPPLTWIGEDSGGDGDPTVQGAPGEKEEASDLAAIPVGAIVPFAGAEAASDAAITQTAIVPEGAFSAPAASTEPPADGATLAQAPASDLQGTQAESGAEPASAAPVDAANTPPAETPPSA